MSVESQMSKDSPPTLLDIVDINEDVLNQYNEQIRNGEELAESEMRSWMKANLLQTGMIARSFSQLSTEEIATMFEETADTVRDIYSDE